MTNVSKFLLVTLLATLMQTNVHADPYRHDHWGGDIHRFHEHDFDRWRAGRWFHGWNGGRYTWWWIAGGVWYPYPAPVRPYPDPYQPPVVVIQQPQQSQYVQQPDANANVTSTAPLPPPPAAASATQYWYYCASPAGYYPYVPQCQGGWQKVPASPPSQ
jgi:hypothetical protein